MIQENFFASVKWTEATLGQVVSKLVDGSHNPPLESPTGLPMLSARNVDWSTINFDKFRTISCRDFEKETERAGPRTGDVLLTIVGTIGRAAVVGDLTPAFALQRSVALLRPNNINSKFLMYFLLSEESQQWLKKHAKGTAQLGVYLKELRNLPVRFPDLHIQIEIVAEIEKQFSRLDAGIAALKRAQANLKRYRASVLKSACEGQLVGNECLIRERRGETYESGSSLIQRIANSRSVQRCSKTLGESTMVRDHISPPGWSLTTVEFITDYHRKSAYGVLQPGEDTPLGIPLVRVGDISNGKIDQTALKRISRSISDQYPRTILRGGELLITLVGAIGRTALVPNSLAGANVARAVGVVPLTPEINASWIELWFRNPKMVAHMTNQSHEVARKTLNLEDVRKALVAVPPLAEQERIVAEVERLLSVADAIETNLEQQLSRATRLRQAILSTAFNNEKSIKEPCRA